MIKSGTCPECGRKVGINHNVSPWKHAVYCLNIPFGPIDQALGQHQANADAGDARASHIVALAKMEVA